MKIFLENVDCHHCPYHLHLFLKMFLDTCLKLFSDKEIKFA
uniref:Uncharacterized protein n=1 Tax=Rhizophora mucronata TaxID=61149 RepID=A0A2P2NIS7_RHIMU